MRAPVSHRFVRLLVGLGLAGALLLPALAAPASAKEGDLVLRVGTVQDLDSLNPYQTLLVVGLRGLPAHLQPARRLRPRPRAGARLRRQVGARRRRQSWTFHIRDGHEVVGRHAGHLPGRLLLVGPRGGRHRRRGEHRRRLPGSRPSRTRASPRSSAPTTRRSSPTRRTRPTGSSRSTCRSSRSTSGASSTTRRSARPSSTAPLVGTGPYTLAEWKTGQFARFVRNPSYWGTQGAADEIVIVFSRTPTRWSRRSRRASSTTPATRTPTSSRRSRPSRASRPSSASANGWTQLAFNTYGTRTGKTIKGGGPSTKALLDPAFRDALGYAVDKADARRPRPRRLRRRRHDDRPAGPRPVARRARQPAHVRHRAGQAEARRGRLQARRERHPPGQGGQADQPAPLHARHGRRVSEGRPVRQGLVRPARDQGRRPRSTTRRRSANIVLPPEACEEPNCAEYKADYDIELWGWAGNPDPNALLQIFRCDAIGDVLGQPVLQPRVRRAVRRADRTRPPARSARRSWPRCRTSSTTRRRTTSSTTTRTSTPTAPTSSPAGRTSPANGTPLFTYGTLHYTLLTDATPAPTPTAAPSAEPGASAAGSPDAGARPAASRTGVGQPGADRTRCSSAPSSSWSGSCSWSSSGRRSARAGGEDEEE